MEQQQRQQLEARANELLGVADWRRVRPHRGVPFPKVPPEDTGQQWAELEDAVLAALTDDSPASLVHLAAVVIYSAAIDRAYRVFPRPRSASDAREDDAALARRTAEGMYVLRAARARIERYLLRHGAISERPGAVDAFELDLRGRLLDIERNVAAIAQTMEDAALAAGPGLEMDAVANYLLAMVGTRLERVMHPPSDKEVEMVVDKMMRGIPIRAVDLPGGAALTPEARRKLDDALTVDPVARAAAIADALQM